MLLLGAWGASGLISRQVRLEGQERREGGQPVSRLLFPLASIALLPPRARSPHTRGFQDRRILRGLCETRHLAGLLECEP